MRAAFVRRLRVRRPPFERHVDGDRIEPAAVTQQPQHAAVFHGFGQLLGDDVKEPLVVGRRLRERAQRVG